MTKTQTPGVEARPTSVLTERDNQRAIDIIEAAERSAPYCSCGDHMVAVAHDTNVWLECSSRSRQRDGLAGLVDRVTSFTHSRRMIMEVPSA